MSEFNLDGRIGEILWPHPFSGEPVQVATSSGLPPEGKVFVAPYAMTSTAIKQLIRDVIAEVTPEPKFIEWGVNNGGRMIDVDELEDKVKGLGL